MAMALLTLGTKVEWFLNIKWVEISGRFLDTKIKLQRCLAISAAKLSC